MKRCKNIFHYKKLSYNYNKLFKKITHINKDNLDWWVTSSANRNPFVSPLFIKYCENILSVGRRENIKIENQEFLKRELKYGFITEIYEYIVRFIKYNLKIFIRKYLLFFYEIVRKLVQLAAARITRNDDITFSKPLILIDIFALPGFYSRDRYYTGLWDSLTQNEKSFVYFVPTITNTKIKDFIKVYKEVRSSERNILVKEDFLKISDIIFALIHFFRVMFLKFPTFVEDGFDLSIPIKKELQTCSGFSSAVEGILNYRFIRRLKKNNVQLKLVVDWWESQALDKGLHLAMHHFYPDIPVIGYLGYAPRELELQLFPTEYESNANVIPKVIGVIGDGFVEKIKRYYPDQKVMKVPAFRFQHLWNEKKSKNDDRPSILIALTVLHRESFIILNMIKTNLFIIKKNNLDIHVKPHPSMSIDQMKKGLNSDWPNEFKIVQGATDKYIQSSKVLVTGMSSIALESLAIGKPVIVIENPDELPLIPIPDDIPKDMWRYCSDESQVYDALKHFLYIELDDQKKFSQKGKNIREKYFEPVTRRGVQNFLKL